VLLIDGYQRIVAEAACDRMIRLADDLTAIAKRFPPYWVVGPARTGNACRVHGQ
jgi:hypothetical protein